MILFVALQIMKCPFKRQFWKFMIWQKRKKILKRTFSACSYCTIRPTINLFYFENTALLRCTNSDIIIFCSSSLKGRFHSFSVRACIGPIWRASQGRILRASQGPILRASQGSIWRAGQGPMLLFFQ